MSTDETMRELLETFRVEVTELFDELATHMAELANRSGEELRGSVRAAMRLAHNLKGSSSAIGLDVLSRLAHELESTLAPLCDAQSPPPPSVTDVLLAAVVTAQRLGEAPSIDETLQQEATEVQRRLSELRGSGSRPPTSLAKNTDRVPSHSPHEPPEPPGAAEARSRDDVGTPVNQTMTYVRVPTERLEALAGHLDELLAVHGQLGEQYETMRRTLVELESAAASPAVVSFKGVVSAQRKSHSTLSRLVSDLTLTVQRIRTVPLATVASQWRRVVRDCAQSLGKEVTLQVKVGDTEVDKQVLDQLRDPIIHLLRNAVDHGIEAAEERHLLGKAKAGTISLSAQMLGAHVLIEVNDDGRGLEPDEIAEAAIGRDLVSREQVTRMSSADKLDLLFRDGFSTAASVSVISGRGVGMSAVREDIARLRGSCTIESGGYGEGTTVRLRVPISVIATRGLLVRVDRVVYMLPIEAVERTLRMTGTQIRTIDGAPVLPLGDADSIPLIWMPGRGTAWVLGDSVMDVVVLAFGTERVGLVVNEVLDEQECVTRRLPWNLQRVPGVNGVVVRHDGTVAVALDVQYLLHDARDGRAPALTETRADEIRGPARILVVDDSLTNRTLQRNILATAGYVVDVAVDGCAAWDQLQRESYDLLVTDVQMPEMDGLELTRRVRASTQLKQLPVILVTSRGRSSDVQLGAAAGADEYLVKGQFDHDKLLEAVGRHVFTEAQS